MDKLHGKNLAKVTRLHTLLVLNVLKMLEATSFEKINTVKSGLGCKTSNATELNDPSILATLYGYSKKANSQG